MQIIINPKNLTLEDLRIIDGYVDTEIVIGASKNEVYDKVYDLYDLACWEIFRDAFQINGMYAIIVWRPTIAEDK